MLKPWRYQGYGHLDKNAMQSQQLSRLYMNLTSSASSKTECTRVSRSGVIAKRTAYSGKDYLRT